MAATGSVALTFPDGARREYPKGITGSDVAKAISPSLAKRTVAMALDGALADLADPIERDAKIEFVNRDDPHVFGMPFMFAWIVFWIAAVPAFLWVVHHKVEGRR